MYNCSTASGERKNTYVPVVIEPLRVAYMIYKAENIIDGAEDPILTSLIRLDTTRSNNLLSPEECIAYTQEVHDSGSVNAVAHTHGVNHQSVSRAVRDTTAALMHYINYKGDIPSEVLDRVKLLKSIDHELEEANRRFDDYEIQKLLGTIPHVRELVQNYLHYRTIKPLFDKLNITYKPAQMHLIHRFIFEDSIESAKRLRLLAQRYVSGLWAYGANTPHTQIGRYLSEATAFLFSLDLTPLSEKDAMRIRDMRTFLTDIGNQESLIVACKKFAGDVANSVSQEKMISCIRRGDNISDKRRNAIYFAGRQFVERSLALTRVDAECMQYSHFTLDTYEVLRAIKQRMLLKNSL